MLISTLETSVQANFGEVVKTRNMNVQIKINVSVDNPPMSLAR